MADVSPQKKEEDVYLIVTLIGPLSSRGIFEMDAPYLTDGRRRLRREMWYWFRAARRSHPFANDSALVPPLRRPSLCLI